MPNVKRSRHSFPETVSLLLNAIAAAGNTVFATIDQAAAASAAGLRLRPTTLIVFGNPKAGTVLMDAFPLLALELPVKLLVWEDGAGVHVAYTPISEPATRYGVEGQDAVLGAIDAVLGTLSDAVR